MTEQQVTLIVAGIAAVASLGTLIITLRAQRRAELRAAQRDALERVVAELGDLLYAVVAMSKRLGMAEAEKRYEENKKRATETARKLDLLRRKVRYSLWGLNDGIHTLILLPRWAEFTRGDNAATENLIAQATALRGALDEAIRVSYANGEPPLSHHCHVVRTQNDALRALYESIKGNGGPESDQLETHT